MWFMPPKPRTWPDGREFEGAWRRYFVLADLSATTGTALGCLFGCTLLHFGSSTPPPTALAYMPAGVLSLSFLALLVASELLQDLIYWMVFVQEFCIPPAWATLSPDARAVLKAKAQPPIFTSWQTFGSFMLPLVAAGATTHPFVWAYTDFHEYHNATVL